MAKRSWHLPEKDGWVNFDLSIVPGEKLPKETWLAMCLGSTESAKKWGIGYFKEFKTKVRISARLKTEDKTKLDGLEIVTT